MAKELQFNQDAKDSILRGATLVKDAVAETLGPRGNNVAIEYPMGIIPRVVHDGVTVAKEVDPEDAFEKIGADLVKEAARRTNDAAGDGTTTAIVLAHAILEESLKNIAAGSNAMMIRRGIEAAVQAVTGRLWDMTQKVKTAEQKKQIATISAQNEEIGELIVAALEKVGDEGVITVERGNTADIEIEYKEGMQFDKGWISPHFINNPTTGEAIVEDPVIIVTNKTIGNIQELLPLMQKVIDVKKHPRIVVIANNVIGEPLATFALNSIKGSVQCICIQAPGFGDQRDAMLEDIACITGAVYVDEQTGKGLNELEFEDLGRAQRVTSSKEQTVIVGGMGDKKAIQDRIDYLRKQLERSDISEYQMERFKERLAKLVAGVAVINVGANSDAEADEKRERVIDAVSATRAAVEEGIVPGGETALLHASKVLDELEAEPRELQIGVDIVRKACRYPYLRLLANSGISEADAQRLIDAHAKTDEIVGIDVIDGKAKPLVKAGVIDPVKVTRSALQNAASTATMLMTTNVLIVSKKEQQNASTQLPGFPGLQQ